jgi:hypothetical protein
METPRTSKSYLNGGNSMNRKVLMVAAVVFAVVLLSVALVYAADGKTYKGWVVDQLCASKGVGIDGTDLKTSPQNHTVGCALMPPCIASGYGIYVDKGDGSFVFYKLDKKGSDLALGILKNETKTDHVQFEITGALKGDTIQVKTLKEI